MTYIYKWDCRLKKAKQLEKKESHEGGGCVALATDTL